MGGRLANNSRMLEGEKVQEMSKHAEIYKSIKILHEIVKRNGYKPEHREALRIVRTYVYENVHFDKKVDSIDKHLKGLESYAHERMTNILKIFKNRMVKCVKIRKQVWEQNKESEGL